MHARCRRRLSPECPILAKGLPYPTRAPSELGELSSKIREIRGPPEPARKGQNLASLACRQMAATCIADGPFFCDRRFPAGSIIS